MLMIEKLESKDNITSFFFSGSFILRRMQTKLMKIRPKYGKLYAILRHFNFKILAKLLKILFQVLLSPFPPDTPPDSSHPHFPPLILPLFGFGHVSFTDKDNITSKIAAVNILLYIFWISFFTWINVFKFLLLLFPLENIS